LLRLHSGVLGSRGHEERDQNPGLRGRRDLETEVKMTAAAAIAVGLRCRRAGIRAGSQIQAITASETRRHLDAYDGHQQQSDH